MASELKILLLAPRIYPFHIGGTEIAYYNLINSLLRKGIDVQVVTCYRKPLKKPSEPLRFPTFLLRTDLILPHFGGWAWVFLRFLLYSSGCIFYTLFKRGKFDIIHLQSILYDIGPFSIMLGKLLRKPVVIWGRGGDIYRYDKQHKYVRFLVRWTIKKADIVLALSNDMKKRIEEISGRKDIIVLPNGVNMIDAPPLEKTLLLRKLLIDKDPSEVRILLYCGRMIDFKGVEYLVRAIPKVTSRFPNVHFVLIGKGTMRTQLIRLCHSLGVDRHTTFIEKVPHEELLTWIPNFELFVYPDLTGQGIPNAVLEAMAAGIPVVATEVGGLPEIVTHGKTGLLVKPKDQEEIGDAINTLLENEDIRRSMSVNAKSIMKNQFSWVQIANRVINAYHLALKSEHFDKIKKDNG